jgi:hypothetical protein
MSEPMQKAGETCKSCADFIKPNGKILKNLPGKTERKKLDVPACPYCDGEEIFTLKN